jgi:hypothetical protein
MFDAQFSWPLAHAQAELALREDRDQAAFQAIAEGLAAMSRAGDDTGWPVLYAVGLAAAADRAERVSARRATAQAEASRRDGDALLARLEATGGPPDRGPETAAVLLQCRADRAACATAPTRPLGSRPRPAGKRSASPTRPPVRSQQVQQCRYNHPCRLAQRSKMAEITIIAASTTARWGKSVRSLTMMFIP